MIIVKWRRIKKSETKEENNSLKRNKSAMKVSTGEAS